MKITQKGTDYITINDENINDNSLKTISRVHLIGLNFNDPTSDKIQKVMDIWDKTNRFVVYNNIKIYNNLLKETAKKYYIGNNQGDKLISFMRRNNKVLLNFLNLNSFDFQYLFSSSEVLIDVLRNVEVVEVAKTHYNIFKEHFENWSGNVIID